MNKQVQRCLLALLSAALVASLSGGTAAAQGSGPARLYLPLSFGPPPPPAEMRLVAAADAYISEGEPTRNDGSAAYLLVGNNQPDDPPGDPTLGALRSLIRFELPAQLPAPVVSATLRVYYWDAWDYPDLSRTVTVYAADGPWEESDVTWANQPEKSAAAYGSAGIRSGDEPGYREIAATDLVRAWADGSAANYGLYLLGPEVSGSDASYRVFLSRESVSSSSPYPPELIIRF